MFNEDNTNNFTKILAMKRRLLSFALIFLFLNMNA